MHFFGATATPVLDLSSFQSQSGFCLMHFFVEANVSAEVGTGNHPDRRRTHCCIIRTFILKLEIRTSFSRIKDSLTVYSST